MRVTLRAAVLACSALTVAGIASSCGGRSTIRGLEVATSCPPAPLVGPAPEGRCSFSGTCSYAAPRGIQAEWFDPANQATCSCEDGGWVCSSSLVDCIGASCEPPLCPFPLVLGQACGQPSNAECLLPAGSLDSSDRDQVCACDEPGPVWRCLER